ncbi:hypothetical protein A4X13_0g5379 [Tilletia indica]|uniref:Uncharacterized protein n=1 Tax=Tilletia indica TaxID=43049 RepID=A0A177TTT4_9BASI|nr:hypothetical protein A4X13_0g5379 [Tilletia indica]
MTPEKSERKKLGDYTVEGSPLETVYVPATRRSGTASPTLAAQPSTAAASIAGAITGGGEGGDGGDDKEQIIQTQKKRGLVLLRKLEHELKVQRARSPRLATTLSLLSEGEGRDALLSLTQSVLLAAHHALSLPPPRRPLIPGYSYLRALPSLIFPSSSSASEELSKPRSTRPLKTVSTNTLKQIYLAQELIASLKRCFLVGKWMSDLALGASTRLSGDADKGDDEAQSPEKEGGDRQEVSGSGFILDPPVSFTDVARLAQHGLALEGLLPLAGGSGSSKARGKNNRQIEAAGSGQAQTSNTRGLGADGSGAISSQDTNWTRRDENESVTSSLPKTFKERLLGFGEIRPALREGEDAVFAGQLSDKAGAGIEETNAIQVVPRGETGDLEPELTVESSWAMIQDHTEGRRHLTAAAAHSTARESKHDTGDEMAGLMADDDALHIGRRRQYEVGQGAGEDEEAEEEEEDEDEDDDVASEVTPEAEPLVPYNPHNDSLLDTDSVDPADMATPLPPIGTRSSFSAMDRWLSVWEGRLEALLFSAGTLAELADVLAFFSGTSVAWRWFRRTYMSRMSPHLSAFPSPLATPSGGALITRRQRQGLERTAVLLSALCGVLSLILVRIKRNRAKRRRREVARRFRAVMDGMEWREAMEARSMAARFATGQQLPSSSATDPDGQDPTADTSAAQLARLTRAQRAFLTYDGALSTLSLHIRWLARERWATLGDTGFLFYEILRPGVDKEGWEAWTGILTAVVRVGRVWTEHFVGRSV